MHAGPAKSNAIPVGITCTLVPGGATVRLTAQAALKQVQVKAWGTRGLTITSGVAPDVQDWSPGQVVTLSVQFEAPPPGASLAVSVAGISNGQPRTRVVSFVCAEGATLGKPTTTVDPTTGRALRVLPAK